MKKHLSTIANDLLHRCAQTLDTSADALVNEFEVDLKPEVDNYSRKLVEFCSSKALENLCGNIKETIIDGSLSRFTFDMMLAWETPSSADDESYSERIAKEGEDRKERLIGNRAQFNDDISLFYSDIMPLLVNEERSVGDESFVWLGSVFPLVADVTNVRFTFETLTAPTACKLHYPGYDRFLREIDKCIRHLQKQSAPTGYELAEDEFILHVEGTASTQRVIRHIGATSWPGRLTLTNLALYFEASKAISYETALKIDASNVDVDHHVKAASTGPWGAPLFDKAIAYESSQLSEPVVVEFPEMTSSTRRDHWLALVKEVILLHQFISKFDIDSPLQKWEIHSRTILGIIRLHATREMLRIAPPAPINFLIFSLFDDLPKGDYVLEELSSSLKQTNSMNPCSATSVLKNLGMYPPTISSMQVKEGIEEPLIGREEVALASLGTTIDQAREEAREASIAKATVEGMKDEGITDSLLVLVELLSPLKYVPDLVQSIIRWERPILSLCVLAMTLIITYEEWIGYTIAAFLLSGVGMMLWARRRKVEDRPEEVVVSTASDKTTMESLVAAQYSLQNVHELVKTTNIAILKIQSILVSRAPKHTNQMMWAMTGAAALLTVIPFKFAIMSLTVYIFMASLKAGRSVSDTQGDRRLREWWDAIPVVPVRTVSNPP